MSITCLSQPCRHLCYCSKNNNNNKIDFYFNYQWLAKDTSEIDRDALKPINMDLHQASNASRHPSTRGSFASDPLNAYSLYGHHGKILKSGLKERSAIMEFNLSGRTNAWLTLA